MFIANAFSLNMLKPETISMGINISITPIEASDVPSDIISAIGHLETAKILSGILGREIPVNRTNVILGNYDSLIVAQYSGPRLPEGATTLPEGSKILFFIVCVFDNE